MSELFSCKMFLAVTLYVPLSVNATLLNVKPDRSAEGSLLDNDVLVILETVTFGSGNPVMMQRFFKVSPTLTQAVISLLQFTLISSEETKSSCSNNQRDQNSATSQKKAILPTIED